MCSDVDRCSQLVQLITSPRKQVASAAVAFEAAAQNPAAMPTRDAESALSRPEQLAQASQQPCCLLARLESLQADEEHTAELRNQPQLHPSSVSLLDKVLEHKPIASAQQQGSEQVAVAPSVAETCTQVRVSWPAASQVTEVIGHQLVPDEVEVFPDSSCGPASTSAATTVLKLQQASTSSPVAEQRPDRAQSKAFASLLEAMLEGGSFGGHGCASQMSASEGQPISLTQSGSEPLELSLPATTASLQQPASQGASVQSGPAPPATSPSAPKAAQLEQVVNAPGTRPAWYLASPAQPEESLDKQQLFSQTLEAGASALPGNSAEVQAAASKSFSIPAWENTALAEPSRQSFQPGDDCAPPKRRKTLREKLRALPKPKKQEPAAPDVGPSCLAAGSASVPGDDPGKEPEQDRLPLHLRMAQRTAAAMQSWRQESRAKTPCSREAVADWETQRKRFECPICLELLVAVYGGNPCGHWLCGPCFTKLLCNKSTCPTCRARLKGPPVRSWQIDDFINELSTKHLSAEELEERERRIEVWQGVSKGITAEWERRKW